MDKILEKVREFADRAHGDQKRKFSSEKYIAHPVRVMEICSQHTSELPVLAAALLHDVLEDTSINKDKMQDFLTSVMTAEQTSTTVKLVVELTDVYRKDKFPNWNREKRKEKEAERIEKTSGTSQTIKYADIIDNCRETGNYDTEFAELFLQECKSLLVKIPKGDKNLYKAALKKVNECIQQQQQLKASQPGK